jgi:hypothetical protein
LSDEIINVYLQVSAELERIVSTGI